MRLGFMRRKNTDTLLPFANGSRSRTGPSRSASSRRPALTRRHVFIGIFLFFLLVLLFRSAGSSKPKRGQPKDRYDMYFMAREDLFNDRLYSIKSVASVCVRMDKNGTMWPPAQFRYPPLGMDENAELDHKYYFALMLKNSATHIPTIIDNLLRVFYHIGEKNIFLSIYEGGSTDEGHTTALLGDPLKKVLDAIGIEYHIELEHHITPDLLNGGLQPLKAMYKANQRVFNSVVMMGDDLWCAEELLELLFQSRGQAASITCSTDVRVKDEVYAIPSGHDINGKLFLHGHISQYIQDEFTSTRFRNNYPLRVQSCFGSITVLDPTPLYPPYDFFFATPQYQRPADYRPAPWENKCNFSPELDMALRYAASGFGREMLVPRTQTAENLLEYFKIHRTTEEMTEREQLHRQLGMYVEEDTGGKENPFATDYDPHENDIITKISPRVADRFECDAVNGIEWIKFTIPQTFENVLVIHRELPNLDE